LASTVPNQDRDTRPGLAILANCVTPYRVHLHRLVAAGIPELKLHTLISHSAADFDWEVELPPEINGSHWGSASDSPLAPWYQSPLREWRKGGQLMEYLQRNDIRAVICVGYRYFSYLRIIRYCHRAKIPLFVRSDSNIQCEAQISPVKQFLKKRIYTWWIPRVSGIMSMGEYGDQFFLKYGADRRHMYHVPYVPDYSDYAKVDSKRLERFRQKFRLQNNRKYFMYCGRLAPIKRVDLLVEAFSKIVDERPDWDLLIVGDGPLRQELEQLVPEKIKERVVWTDFLEGEEIALAYNASDVLVLPSDREPWALVVQEAMAAGMIVVASDVVGAAHELVEDKKSGRIFPKGEVESLQEAMLDVSCSHATINYQEQSRNSLADWRKKLDPVTEIRRALVDVGVVPKTITEG